MARRRRAVLLVLASVLTPLAACGDDDRDTPTNRVLGDDTITIGSFDFAESELLAEIYAQALEGAGITVDRAFRLGPRELVAPALTRGLVEFVPEYAGTAVQFLSLDATVGTSDVDATHAALVEALEPTGLRALAPSPAQDANTIVVTRTTAAQHGIDEISDLAPLADTLRLGGPPECPNRPLCLPGLERAYDLTFAEFIPLDAGGPLTRQALDEGYIDVAIVFSTDPSADDYVALTDDEGLQPAENVTPVVREEVVDRWGSQLVEAVDPVSAALTTVELRALNRRVAEGDSGVAAVAAAWLASKGLG